MTSVESSGSYGNTEDWLGKLLKGEIFKNLQHYGELGVTALASVTPVDTGLTEHSWTYDITNEPGEVSINWHNTNVVNGTPLVIMIQYGHGTGTGGWVEGRDFINPAIHPVFDHITDEIWKQVTNG